MEYDELYEDDLDILDIIQDGFPRNNWERPNYFEEIDDLSFFRRFRLTKPSVAELLEEIGEALSYDRNV